MSPRESNEATGTETGSVRVAVIGAVAFSSKHPPPDMRLRRNRRDQAGSSVLSACCPCEPVQTATPPTGPWRAPQNSRRQDKTYCEEGDRRDHKSQGMRPSLPAPAEVL